MSDSSQGADWWQANDGKWYPPTTAPANAAQRQYCTNCAAEVTQGAAACTVCGFSPTAQRKFCAGCGAVTNPGQLVCTACGRAVAGGAPGQYGDKSKVAAGVLGILLGGFGAHKFYLGRTNAALIMLGATVGGVCAGSVLGFFTLGFGFILYFAAPASAIVGVVEGIIYLTKTDEQFYEEYVVRGKDWF